MLARCHSIWEATFFNLWGLFDTDVILELSSWFCRGGRSSNFGLFFIINEGLLEVERKVLGLRKSDLHCFMKCLSSCKLFFGCKFLSCLDVNSILDERIIFLGLKVFKVNILSKNVLEGEETVAR